MTEVLPVPAGPDVVGARGGPRYRPLAVLLALVVAAHVLVLQSSPGQFGHFAGATDPDEAGGKSFATRSIEVPSKPAEPVAAATVKPAAAPSLNAPQSPPPAPKNKPNKPLDQQIRAQAVTESIASTVPPSATPTDTSTIASAPATPTLTAVLEAPLSRAGMQSDIVPPPATATAPASSSSLIGNPTITQVSAVSLPASTRLQYKVIGQAKGLNYQATSELLYKASGDKYEAVVSVRAFLVGSRSLTSVGQITASGLAPTRFSDKSRQELAAHFEPAAGKIVFSANTPEVPWVQGAQDRVSVLLQMVGIVAAAPADYPPGASMSMYTVGPRDAETWTFVVEQPENLDVMGAPMATLKLTRKARREFDQKVELWLAPSLGYLPVRNRVTQPNGDFIDQRLSEVNKL